MKASVIIPVYNAEKTIRKCVESLVYGEENDIEIILIDDCSSDCSRKVCSELECDFEQVKVFTNSRNSGVSYTRNQGLKYATGEYILFVDSDDWVSKWYAKELLADTNPEVFTVCGYTYIDLLSNVKGVCKLNDGNEYTSENQIYNLFKATLLQQLWNKVFRRDIIISNNISFDTRQTMGEDFQFVLDYIECACIKKWHIINKPLYYYFRASQTSLMSKFGWNDTEFELKRLYRMFKLSGSENYRRQLNTLIIDTKNNYIYHISRTKGKTIEDKVRQIEIIMNDGKAYLYYIRELKGIIKEKLVDLIMYFAVLKKNINNYIKQKKNKRIIAITQKYITNKQDISVISQDCLGTELLRDMNWPYFSPTIDLCFNSKDFIKFVLNLEKYLSYELKMEWGEMWPIGRLEDITIQFVNYTTCTDAKIDWEKRKHSVNFNKILVLATDKEGFSEEDSQNWQLIPYPKLLFTAQQKYKDYKEVVYYPEYEKYGCVQDLISDRAFYKNNILATVIKQL